MRLDRSGQQLQNTRLHHLDAVVLQRDRAEALAGRGEERVEDRRRGYADRRLADAAPEPAGRHDDRLDLRHLRDLHRVVGVEVRLLHAAVLDRALLKEEPGQAVNERAGDLPLDLGRVDGVAGVRCGDDAMDLHLVTVLDRDLRASRHIAVERHHLRQAAMHALRRRLAPTRPVGHRVEHREVLGMLVHQLARNSSGSWPAAWTSSSMKHSRKIAFWLMFTPRQNPGGTCVLRIAWSMSKSGMVYPIAKSPLGLSPWNTSGSFPS